MSNFNKGDIVEVFDGSWSLAVEDNKFRHSFGREMFRRDFEVLYTGLVLPSSDVDEVNNIIIKAKDNGQIIFTQERFIKPKVKPALLQPIIINLATNNELPVELLEEIEKKIKSMIFEFNLKRKPF